MQRRKLAIYLVAASLLSQVRSVWLTYSILEGPFHIVSSMLSPLDTCGRPASCHSVISRIRSAVPPAINRWIFAAHHGVYFVAHL